MSLPKLGYKKTVAPVLVTFTQISCFGVSKLPCCEQPHGEAHMTNKLMHPANNQSPEACQQLEAGILRPADNAE